MMPVDWRTGGGESGTGASSEWVEGKMRADGETSAGTAPGGREETCRRNSVSQANQPATQGMTTPATTTGFDDYNNNKTK